MLIDAGQRGAALLGQVEVGYGRNKDERVEGGASLDEFNSLSQENMVKGYSSEREDGIITSHSDRSRLRSRKTATRVGTEGGSRPIRRVEVNSRGLLEQHIQDLRELGSANMMARRDSQSKPYCKRARETYFGRLLVVTSKLNRLDGHRADVSPRLSSLLEHGRPGSTSYDGLFGREVERVDLDFGVVDKSGVEEGSERGEVSMVRAGENNLDRGDEREEKRVS